MSVNSEFVKKFNELVFSAGEHGDADDQHTLERNTRPASHKRRSTAEVSGTDTDVVAIERSYPTKFIHGGIDEEIEKKRIGMESRILVAVHLCLGRSEGGGGAKYTVNSGVSLVGQPYTVYFKLGIRHVM